MGYYLKVAGVTFGDRQRAISSLKELQELLLVREPNNPYDKQAIAVKTLTGDQLGYIPTIRNGQMAYKMDWGQKYRVSVSAVTGGGIGMSYGLNIFIEEK